MKDVECFKCLEIKAKDAKGAFKVRKVDDSSVKEERKAIRQIRIRYSDFSRSEKIVLCDIGLFYLTWDKLDILRKSSWIWPLIVIQFVENCIGP